MAEAALADSPGQGQLRLQMRSGLRMLADARDAFGLALLLLKSTHLST